MRKLFLLLLACAGLWVSCDNESMETYTWKVNEPILMSPTEFRNSVKVTTVPHTLGNYGKICFYNGYLYISEPEKGIHIINNTDPSNPTIVGYVELIGNFDLAIRNGLLYADSYIDLVWFDITNPAKPELKGRLEEAFPQALPIIENEYGYDYAMCYSTNKKGIVVGWELKERVEKVKHSGGDYYYESSNGLSTDSKGGSATGQNGSMSRFGLYKDYLYTVINNHMSIFNLSGSTPVKAVEDLYIGRDVETIFSYENKMFMGTPTGMLIYSVEDPLKPKYCSGITHILGCDPVVVEDNLAYVTVHSGNFCGQNNDELFIVDVSDVYHPRQLVSYTMKNPKGLGIDKGTLFLCDDGLKIYNAEDPLLLMGNQLAHHTGMDGFDVIPSNNVLMMIADNGLYQYDYSNLNDIRQLSLLPINK